MRELNLLEKIGLSFCALPFTASADVFDTLKPGEWYEVPNSRMDAVKPDPLPMNGSGFSVMSAWSGGSFDSKRDRLLVWGGGHSDYSGNEIYAFDIATLKWIRVNEPSADVGGSEATGMYPDGAPRSRHTYNYIQYVPVIDRFCSFGGSDMYPTAGYGVKTTQCFDFDVRKWETKADATPAFVGSISCYDFDSRKIWMRGAGSNGIFASWDPVNDVWTNGSTYGNGWFPYDYTAACGQGKLVAVGKGKVMVWDLNNPQAAGVALTTIGDTAILSKANPGFTYDSKKGYFIAWAGGSEVYALNLGSRAWTRLPLATTNKVTPTPAEARGTFGRFQYIRSKDAFVAANRVTENVYIYKISDQLIPNAVNDPVRSGRKPLILTFPAHASRFTRDLNLMVPEAFNAGDRVTCRAFDAYGGLRFQSSQAVLSGSGKRNTMGLSAAANGASATFFEITKDGRRFFARAQD